MINLGRSVRALFCSPPRLPSISGDAFVFGAAPNPTVPDALLKASTIVTANASQVYLEQFGVTKPDITFMRTNMDDGRDTSAMKLEKLRDRSTGLLVLSTPGDDPEALRQRDLLDAVNYGYDGLLLLDKIDSNVIQCQLLNPRTSRLLRFYSPSMGLRAILVCLAMGARSVAVSGVSFRSDGCSFSDLDYTRRHVDGDRKIIERIVRNRLPVYAVDAELIADTGLRPWPGDARPAIACTSAKAS